MTRKLLEALLAFCLWGLASSSVTRRYKLQHAFGVGEEFVDRGAVEIAVDTAGLLSVKGAGADPVSVESSRVAKLEAGAKSGALYRIRAVPEGKGTPIMTTVRLCDVVRANFRENITLNVNVEGFVIGLEYMPRMSYLSPKNCQAIKLPESVQFSTALEVGIDSLGQSIPLQAPGSLPPGIRIRLDEHEAPPPPPKSFLQKYWIFIVLALLLFNSSAAPEDDPRAAGGQGGGAAGGQAGGGAARPVRRAPGPQQRR